MATQPVCIKCGESMELRWLFCRRCGAIQWKLMMPYYVWGVIFTVGGYLAMTQGAKWLGVGTNSAIGLFTPVLGGVFGAIGVAMLLIAVISSLKSLGSRKS